MRGEEGRQGDRETAQGGRKTREMRGEEGREGDSARR